MDYTDKPYDMDREARKLANYMARHIVGKNMAAKDEACRLCIKAAKRALWKAIKHGAQSPHGVIDGD